MQGPRPPIRPVVEASLELDHRRRPSRLYPWRREASEPKIIALDPRRAFGQPIVAGSSVKIEVIIDRIRAGESVATLSADYDMSIDTIEGVLRWGLDGAKAA
jgi:uncharacterized protein (DUF433 family)